MQKEEKMIHGLPKEKWLSAFGSAVEIAIDKDYFGDILYYELYPNEHPKNSDESEKLWKKVEDAFVEIFGYKL